MEKEKENSLENEVVMTRRLVVNREHRALLVWGITSAAIGLLICGLQCLTHNSYSWLWWALPAIAMPLHGYVDKKNDKDEELTPLYKGLGIISKVAIAFIAVAAFATIPFEYNVYFAIMLILSIWCGLSGYMLDYPRLWQLAIGGFTIAIALLIKDPDPYELPVFVVGLCVTLVAPGLDMIRRMKLKNFYEY